MQSQFFKEEAIPIRVPGDVFSWLPAEVLQALIIKLSPTDLLNLSTINNRMLLTLNRFYPREIFKSKMLKGLAKDNVYRESELKPIKILLDQIVASDLKNSESIKLLIKNLSIAKTMAFLDAKTATPFTKTCQALQLKLTNLLKINDLEIITQDFKSQP